MSLKIAPIGPVQVPVPTEGLAFNVYDNPQEASLTPACAKGISINIILTLSVPIHPLLLSVHIKVFVPYTYELAFVF